MEEQPSNLKTPKWLKHLQENSWEAEILISGGAIFSLFQLVDVILKAGDYLREISPFAGLSEVIVFLITIVRGVSIGFILHLGLRGFWIGLVCLRSVFPSGTNFSKLKLTNLYLTETLNVNLTKQIILLDQFIGLVFFGSFLFVISFVGLMVSILAIAGLLQYAHMPLQFSFLLFFLYFIDLLSLGLLRRTKWIGYLFFPIYWFFNIVSLAFLYRPYLQVVSTNIKKWKLALFSILLFTVSSITAYQSVTKAYATPDILDRRNYLATSGEDQRTTWLSEGRYLDKIPDEEKIHWACIQSDIIKDDYLKVFVPYSAKYDSSIGMARNKVFAEIVNLSFNDSIEVTPDWFTYTRKSSDQYGIISYLPIEKLTKGMNKLTVRIKDQTFYFGIDSTLTIPFWK